MWSHDETLTTTCRDVANSETDNSQVSRVRVVLTVISAERRSAFVEDVLHQWKAQGFKASTVSVDNELPTASVKTGEGMTLSVEVMGTGQAQFRTSSGCVGTAGVQEPTIKANGPDFTGREIPRPYIKDDYWSLPEPVTK